MRAWRDSAESDALDTLLARVLAGDVPRMPASCPVCGRAESAHLYFHARGEGRIGGVWVWCSACRCFSHGTVKPPAWWSNPDVVDPETLTAAPEALEELAERIDAHWNTRIAPGVSAGKP
ncbi:hypothetical protein [Myxococcus sp. RHSTA-1-4]|uniref:hypothetical protein n=1 Tax=Myxococcus sp. RHSTA-1-4 TaxID=2874601 RepID=UPI001CBF231B|nr:hypothetical protein [Myxococcus sp. RHSTA-1-4]MBZ4415239.1 hypothetical protein [Myxococcus sp. RHSTA-1-4]